MRKTITIILTALAIMAFASCGGKSVSMPDNAISIASPEGKLSLKVALVDGIPYYALDHGSQAVILPSRLGFDLLKGGRLDGGFTLEGTQESSFDEVWEPVWGEEAQIRNHYNELLVKLHQEGGAEMHIRFRLYDDGLGFRYEFPQNPALVYFRVKEELTQFALSGDHTAWWVPGDYSTQEYTITECKLSEIAKNYADASYASGGPSYKFSSNAVQTAVQMKTAEGLYINIHEAAVLDYPSANLDLDDKNFVLSIHLTPGPLQEPLALGHGLRKRN